MTEHVFRNRTYPVLGTLIVLVGTGIAASVVANLADSDDPTGGILLLILAILMVPIGTLAYIRPQIRATGQGITVRNPTGTRHIPWNEVRALRAEDRVLIDLQDGTTVRCWAVQRANAARVLGRTSHVDNVVRDLEVLRRQAAQPGS